MSLFREQALAAQQTKWLSDIVLIRPISFTLLTTIAVLLAMIVCAFLAWGSYTKHSTVSGQLLPNTGLIKVYPPQTGIVIEQHVKEGQQVKAGEVLYVLSSERHSSTLGATQAAISSQVEQRQVSLRDEMQKTRQLQQEERAGLNNKIAALGNELAKLDNQIAGQQDRVKLAQETLQRYQGLLQQDYISKEQFQQKQEDLLDQKNRQQGLERDRISVGRDLSAQQSELNGLSLKHQNQLAQIDRTLTSTGQELTESEAKRRIVITAPEAGIATAVIADVGQSVDGNRPLVSIVPAGAMLRAELYAPSRAIGFIRPGDQVLIRYQAYPYQKFGHQKGVVESVAKTALPNNELNTIGTPAGSNNSEPMYRINVRLASQQVTAYGKPQALQAGMLLEADVQQEKLHLYEWVLEPLYSLTGKL
ncbi:HlyD family secretion protein [Collimonas sp.]|jgi:membrane fusion protein|uniref:HlyD family secretion protein n=1 Tax=Collimonas sp. TaxID=1963772 RepID=UPI002CD71403|nr:HlyD family efflux transporter periplasmic adaptor subunit [Collimonas sp.]HWW06592.1 HlyD family efflux transporter periplasmic adaptor subunit [Collimonas sp.]